MIVGAAIAAHLLLLLGLLAVWRVERNRLFAILSKTPAAVDDTTKALVPIWWCSLALMLNATSGIQGLPGFAIVSVIAAILLLACARTLARANRREIVLARPPGERRLLYPGLFLLAFGAVVALFNAAERYEAGRHGAVAVPDGAATGPSGLTVQ